LLQATRYTKAVTLTAGAIQGQFTLFPNPVKNEAFIKLSLESAGNAELRVVDYTGRTLHTARQHVSAGASVIQVPGVDQLAKGVYYVQLEVNGVQQVLKLIK
jgi:hypothetical protein